MHEGSYCDDEQSVEKDSSFRNGGDTVLELREEISNSISLGSEV